MFNYKHYVPILKWNSAECGALKELEEIVKKNITPLVQLIMPNEKPDESVDDVVLRYREKILKDLPEHLINTWGKEPMFIDVSLLFTNDLKIETIKTVLNKGKGLGAKMIPVLYLHDDVEVINQIIKANYVGVCLRLVDYDFQDLILMQEGIERIFDSRKVSINESDLLVDIKQYGSDPMKYESYFMKAQKIDKLKNWRTYVFASGSFPVNMSQYRIDEENLVPRLDWLNWKSNIVKKGLVRIPSFSDYSIQYPIYERRARFFHPTTTIKYALDDEWLILKGRKQAFEMYLASAKVLAGSSKFMGADFSAGDKYIEDKSKHFDVYQKDPSVKGTGTSSTWLKAGINHHLSLVARQVSSLS